MFTRCESAPAPPGHWSAGDGDTPAWIIPPPPPQYRDTAWCVPSTIFYNFAGLYFLSIFIVYCTRIDSERAVNTEKV